MSTLREITDEIEFYEQLRKTNPTARVPYTLRELKVQIKYCRDTNKASWIKAATKQKDDIRWERAADMHSLLYSAYSHMYSGNKNKFYLCIINPSADAYREDDVFVQGKYATLSDVNVPGGIAVPHTFEGGYTRFRTVVRPGGFAMIEMDKVK